jgi:hypothetical protein
VLSSSLYRGLRHGSAERASSQASAEGKTCLSLKGEVRVEEAVTNLQ